VLDDTAISPHALVAEAVTREEKEEVACLLDELLEDGDLPGKLEQEIRAALSDLAGDLADAP
jgi:hypothetical protein